MTEVAAKKIKTDYNLPLYMVVLQGCSDKET